MSYEEMARSRDPLGRSVPHQPGRLELAAPETPAPSGAYLGRDRALE
jgi:hypothetical protein